MNNIFRIVLVGPTGAGKSQFCNFLRNDLSNSIYKVKASLNSCTAVPQSTIFVRQNIKIELIDSPGSSDSNNNDENNLKVLANFLRSKNEIHQIFLVLDFEDRLSKSTRDYLKILGNIFPSNKLISHLMVIFTHFPIEADEDDIDKSNTFKKELNDELYKIFQIQENLINNKIPVYFINTKIVNKLQNPHFQEKSLRTAFDLIEELKNRMNFSFGFSVVNSDNFNFIKKVNNNELINKLNELSNIKKEYEKIIFTTLETQVKSQKHSHGVVLLYSNDDWICDICRHFYQKNVSKYYCSFCDFNLCKNCNEKNTKYSLGQFINPAPIKFNKFKFQVHQHKMIFCHSSRSEFGLNRWICDICGRLYSNQTWSFYCTVCDYDICVMCAENKFV